MKNVEACEAGEMMREGKLSCCQSEKFVWTAICCSTKALQKNDSTCGQDLSECIYIQQFCDQREQSASGT